MKMLNREAHAAWVAALRSGEYAQAQNYLQSDRGFCPLGVLCEVAIAAGVPVKTSREDVSDDYCAAAVRYGDGLYLLPDCVKTWAGIVTGPTWHDLQTSVADMNDVPFDAPSFLIVADWIEENL